MNDHLKTMGQRFFWPVCGIVILWAAQRWIPSLPEYALSRPSARLAAWYFGCPVTQDVDGTPVLLHAAYPIRITSDCTGWTFLVLLSALTIWAWTPYRPGRIPMLAAWLLGAFLVALTANSLRLVVAVTAGTMAAGWPRVQPAVHLAAGVSVFFPILLAAWFLIERKLVHERYRP